MKQMTLIRIAVLAVSVLAALASLHTAAAATIPYHEFNTASCVDTGYWGRYIGVVPGRLDVQPGVATTVVGGTGYSPPATHQYIYFRVWAYEYSTARWLASPYKRRLNDDIGSTEEFNPQLRAWTAPDGSLTGSQNLNIGIGEVGVRVNGGWYYVVTETYWDPPRADWGDYPGAQGGGVRTYDFNRWCNFGSPASAKAGGHAVHKRPRVRPALPRR